MNQKELEQDLLQRYQAGDKSTKKELVHSLTPLIRSQASKFKNSGLPYSAIELEGKRLASQAIDTFDPKMGVQLNTHVTNYLKKLSRFTTTYQNVGHIPEPRALMLGKYETMFANLAAEKGREPTLTELADAMQVPPIEIDRLQSERRADLHMELASADPEEGGFSYYVAPNSEDPKLREALEFVYFDSDPINKKILEYTFGLSNVQIITAKEIKDKLKLTEAELQTRKTQLSSEIKSLYY